MLSTKEFYILTKFTGYLLVYNYFFLFLGLFLKIGDMLATLITCWKVSRILRKTCQKTGFLLTRISQIRTQSLFLYLCKNIQVRENPCSGVIYKTETDLLCIEISIIFQNFCYCCICFKNRAFIVFKSRNLHYISNDV